MNKKFLSAILFGALMITSTGTFVSCKDYDDDINGLQEQVDSNKSALESQLSTLQSALSSAQSAAQAAQSAADQAKKDAAAAKQAGDEAMAEALAATAMANTAKAAVETAKAEAIAEAIAEVNKLLAGYATTEDLAELAGKIEGIDPKLEEIWTYIYETLEGADFASMKAIAALQEELDLQKAALENLQAATGDDEALTELWEAINGEDANSISSKLASVINVITDLQAQVDDLNASTMGDDINSLKTQLGTLATHIQEINNQLVTLQSIAGLKSLAFIPEVLNTYGLGVVEFYTLKLKDEDGETVYVSNTPSATYRVNPQNVNQAEYEWSFINRTVKARATGDNNDLITIKKSEAAAGSRVFYLQADKEVLNELEADELPIIALKATDGDCEIVSDYATVTTKVLENFALAQLDAEGDKVDYYATAIPGLGVAADTTLLYTGELDLKPIVEAWETTIPDALVDLNVENIVYTITKVEEYLGTDGVTNQQKFVVLNNGVVKVDNEWLAQGTASIGRTPVFKAVASVNGIEIATGYIKVEIVDEAYVAPTEKGDLVINVNLGDIEYTTIDGDKQYNFDWARANAEVYDALGLTRQSFFDHYVDWAPQTVPTGVSATAWTYFSQNPSETAMAWITMNNQVAFGNDTVAVTYPAKDNTKYPNVVIKFGYNIVHTKTLPALNPDYLIGTNIIQVKGRMEGSAWKLISDMDEHFEDYLAGYQLPKNHTKFYFRFKVEDPAQTGAEITGTDYADQVIKLTTPFAATEASRDYNVQAVAELANGEECVLDYVVRFIRPFNATVDEMKLKTYTANADSVDLAQLVVITDLDNKVVYEEGAFTQYGKDTYKIDQAGITFAYDFEADDSFGDKLTKVDTSWIKWYNGGADLQQNKTAASVVTITIPEIATIEEEGVITVLSTANSK